ncbi:hypothetical protein F5876DRAFT_63579 [Lentinula aff. lateritia]|uniref:Uncharacterized protein n=1 Tax=Lentinula aff. lateritia TaxID=2804960 RepID=A0ACC1U7G5_9AGAR|nr:hypothetical protein F5876DRAFT_63579 [Lentinula aff. lateritia]
MAEPAATTIPAPTSSTHPSTTSIPLPERRPTFPNFPLSTHLTFLSGLTAVLLVPYLLFSRRIRQTTDKTTRVITLLQRNSESIHRRVHDLELLVPNVQAGSNEVVNDLRKEFRGVRKELSDVCGIVDAERQRVDGLMSQTDQINAERELALSLNQQATKATHDTEHLVNQLKTELKVAKLEAHDAKQLYTALHANLIDLKQNLDQTRDMLQKANKLSNDNSASATAQYQSNLQFLLEEAKINRTQGNALRSIGLSLADIAAFMHEVELSIPLLIPPEPTHRPGAGGSAFSADVAEFTEESGQESE